MNEEIYSEKQLSALDNILKKISELPKKSPLKVNGDCEKMKAYVRETSSKVRNEAN